MFTWHNLLENKKQFALWVWALLISIVLVFMVLATQGHRSQQAKQLQVAVVNLDKGGNYQGSTQHIGNDLLQSFKQNKKFTVTTYTTKKQAKKALMSGRVTAVVTIPTDLTSRLDSFKQKANAVALPVWLASGKNNFDAEYIQQAVTDVVAQKSSALAVGLENTGTLQNIAKQSQDLSKDTSDLQVNLKAIANGVDEQAADDLKEEASDTASKMENYSAQLNDAVKAGDTDKIQEMAVAINNLSYTMQTTVVSGISNIATSLSQVKALSDQNGTIQSSAKDIQQQQTKISDKLTDIFSDKNTVSPLSQMLTVKLTDFKPIKQDGQDMLAQIIIVSIVSLALFMGLLLPKLEVTQEALALIQWWRVFSVIAVLNFVAVVLMYMSALLWHITVNNIFGAIAVTTISAWTITSIVWFAKLWLGNKGWWIVTMLLAVQVTVANVHVNHAIWNIVQQILPLSVLYTAIRQFIFGGDVQTYIEILGIWFLVITIILVTYYRVKQRQNFKVSIEKG